MYGFCAKPSAVSSDALYFETTEEAISFLRRTSGRILLTTGSKELSQYAAIEDFSNRVWARVLPLASSLDACQKAGLPPAHIFAMQGPFSAAMNATMLQSITAAFLVTKDGGAPGGFEEKAAGAKQAGAKLVVIVVRRRRMPVFPWRKPSRRFAAASAFL